ncbi:MAG: DegV family protein [Lachnospiraceae bacterium]|nr:DegV family protein [Lachnospiraceae bacterium]
MKSNVAILTDTNSGITMQKAEELGVHLILMPILIDGEVYLEEKDIQKDFFFEKLGSNADVTTSQPSPGDILDKFDTLLKEYEEVVYIPMSSGLSGTCQTASMLAADYDGKVHVVDNQRISVTMRQSVLDAVALAEEGKSGAEIKAYLEEDALNAPIFIMVDTLKYLKKGGRVTAAGAAIGEVLNIKPVLKIDGGKLDAFAKARGTKQALKTILKALETERDTRLKGKECIINGAYSGDDSVGEEWGKILKEAFPEYKIEMYELPMSICAHIGPGAMGVGIYSSYK